MRKQFLMLMVLGAAAMLAGPAWAEPARGDAAAARGDRAREMYDRLMAELKLTEQQKAPVQQILDTFRQEMVQWTQENGPTLRELQEKLRSRRGAEGQADRAEPPADEQRKQAAEKYRELMKQRQDKTDNVLKQLKEHLTAEQMEVAKRYLGAAGGVGERGYAQAMAALGRLDLTDAQKAKVKEIMDAAQQAAEGKDERERYRAMREAWDKITQDVLAPEQRAKLEEIRRGSSQAATGPGRMLEGLDLTEEQKTKANSIMEAARRKIAEAQGAEARRQVYVDAQKEIEGLLTAEQREKYEQRRREARERLQSGRGERPAGPRTGGDAAKEPVIVD